MKKIFFPILMLVSALVFANANAAFADYITLSQSRVDLHAGQTATVTVGGNATGMYVTNSNDQSVGVTLSGNLLNIFGISPGASSVSVCSPNSSFCPGVYVNVGDNYGPIVGNVTLSQNNITLNPAGTSTISIYSGIYNNAYYVSATSNPAVATATISGSTLTVTAISPGSSQITVNGYSGGSATLLVTVSQNYGNFSLSQTNLTLNHGLSATVYVYNNYGTLYISGNSNSNAASATVSGNTLIVQALNPGTTVITVSNSYGSSATLNVTVNDYSPLTLSQTSLSLNIGGSAVVYAYNNNAALYISANSNSNVASASISGNQITVNAINSGSTSITVCRQGNGQCATLYVSVSGYNGLYFSNTYPTQAVVGQYYSYSISVSGGTPGYQFIINSGTLPPGLSLSASGTIYGTPNTAGNYSFSVKAIDSSSRSAISPQMSLQVGSVSGATTYEPGSLIMENGTIYIVYKNTKCGFANMQAFNGLGYQLSNVVTNTNPWLAASPYVVNSANAAHPWGSWIISGSTVYFVHEQGLIPISDYNVFLNNGGTSQMLVGANSYDFAKPILPIMTYNDYRLN